MPPTEPWNWKSPASGARYGYGTRPMTSGVNVAISQPPIKSQRDHGRFVQTIAAAIAPAGNANSDSARISFMRMPNQLGLNISASSNMTSETSADKRLMAAIANSVVRRQA